MARSPKNRREPGSGRKRTLAMVGSEGGAPIAAIAPAKPAVEEAEVPVVQSVVATEAPALVAAPPSAAAPPRGGKGRPAERVPGEGGTPDAKEQQCTHRHHGDRDLSRV